MGNSILYSSCPNKTSVSWWCFKVTGRLTAQFPPFLSSTTALFLAQLNLVQNLIFKWLVASTQGFFTSQGDSLGGMMCQWNTGFERNSPDPRYHPSTPEDAHRGGEQGRLLSSTFMPFCSQAQPILSLKTVMSFLFLESKFLMQLYIKTMLHCFKEK